MADKHKARGGFRFDIGEFVRILVSQECGWVIGRAEYEAGERQYFLRYQAKDGRAVEAWWSESALAEAVEDAA